MAKLSSAQKTGRTSERKRLVNQPVKKGIKTLVSGTVAAVKAGNQAEATDAAKRAVISLDRAVTRGVLHRNNAARRKSRLMKKLNGALQAKPEVAPVAAEKKKA